MVFHGSPERHVEFVCLSVSDDLHVLAEHQKKPSYEAKGTPVWLKTKRCQAVGREGVFSCCNTGEGVALLVNIAIFSNYRNNPPIFIFKNYSYY